MQSTAEFDAFGPWIYEVRTQAELPRLYRDAGIEVADQRLVLKVPRNIERRNATPDLHLYDVLIAVDDTTLTVLQRQEDRYSTTRIRVDRLTAVEDSTDLLDGRLTLHNADSAPVRVSYNAAEQLPVYELVRLLRELYLPATDSDLTYSSGITPDLGGTDRDLAKVCRNLTRAEPRMRVIGTTTRQKLDPPTGLVARAMNVIWPVTLHATIVLADDREVQVIHRRDWLSRGNSDVHSLARTVLVRDRITDLQVAPHEKYRQIEVVTVHSGEGQLELLARNGSGTELLSEAIRSRKRL